MALQCVQRFFDFVAGLFARYGQRQLRQLGAVHAASAFQQVVCFVYQHANSPLVALAQRIQHGGAVEEVVVIAHHHIGPVRQLLRQVVGADLVLQRNAAHALQAVAHIAVGGWFAGLGAGGGQAVVKATGQRARVAMAGFVRVLAAFVAGLQLDYAQGGRWGCAWVVRLQLRAHLLQRVQCQRMAGAFGGEEEDLVQRLRGAGLEHGKERAHGFANAGGRLCHQATAGVRLGSAVNGNRQFALPCAKLPQRKLQRGQRLVACCAVL